MTGTDAMFTPNGGQVCSRCGAALTFFGGRLACFGCTSKAPEEASETTEPVTTTEPGVTACPDCGSESGEDFDSDGCCGPCWSQRNQAENVVTLAHVAHQGGPASNGGAEPNRPSASQPPPYADGWLADPKLRVLDVERMLTTEPEPVPWIVEPLLATGCVTMLAGREGQGKSMLALALASAIGHGANVAGFDCQPGRVLFVDAENGEREAHRRVRGLGVKPGRLTYVEAGGFNLAADVELLIGLIDEHHPGVLVLDSLRSLAPGLDENDSRPVEAALRPVSRLAQDKGLPVLLLHHAGKLGSEYRGSTAIGAAVELGFTLSRRDEDPEKRTRRRLACWKSRPAPEPEPRWITMEAGDGVILLGEAEPFEGEGARKRDELRDEVLSTLAGIAQSRARIARAVDRDAGDSTVRRVLQDLAKEGLAEKRPDGWARRTGLVEGGSGASGPGVA